MIMSNSLIGWGGFPVNGLIGPSLQFVKNPLLSNVRTTRALYEVPITFALPAL